MIISAFKDCVFSSSAANVSLTHHHKIHVTFNISLKTIIIIIIYLTASSVWKCESDLTWKQATMVTTWLQYQLWPLGAAIFCTLVPLKPCLPAEDVETLTMVHSRGVCVFVWWTISVFLTTLTITKNRRWKKKSQSAVTEGRISTKSHLCNHHFKVWQVTRRLWLI